jgi:hypothetical protein
MGRQAPSARKRSAKALLDIEAENRLDVVLEADA